MGAASNGPGAESRILDVPAQPFWLRKTARRETAHDRPRTPPDRIRSFPDASRTPRRNSAHSVLHAFHALLHKASAAPLDANDSTGDISLMPKAISADISAQVSSLACSRRVSLA